MITRKDVYTVLVKVAQVLEALPPGISNSEGVPPDSFDMAAGHRCVLAWARHVLPLDEYDIFNCEKISPFDWMYSAKWAYNADLDANTAKSAAHRIYCWIAYGRRCGVKPERFVWKKFVARYPFDGCKTDALAKLN